MLQTPEQEPASEETVVLQETGLGAYQVKVRSGCATFLVDEPFGVGGLASGPNPYDLLGAAIGASALMTMRLFATERAFPIDQIRVRVTHYRGDQGEQPLFVKEIELTGDLTAGQRDELANLSSLCPVEVAISSGCVVRTILASDEFTDDSALCRYGHVRDMHETIRQNNPT